MDTTSPVIPELKSYEQPLGGPEVGQPQYNGLSVLRSPEGRVISRWTFTEEERRAIAEGADLYLTVMTFNQNFQPVRLDIGSPMPGKSPEGIKRDMRLDDQAEMVALLKEYNRLATEANEARKALEEKQKEVFAPPAKPQITLVQ